MTAELLREMFTRMVIGKDAEALPRYYHPEFVMTSNGHQQRFEEFAAEHQRLYQTSISYLIDYDEAAWVESPDRVAARAWITVQRPGENAHRIEVVLIASYRDGRIHRLWELTWPDWSHLAPFTQAG